MPARDPVAFSLALREFVDPGPKQSTWVRAMAGSPPPARRILPGAYIAPDSL